MQYQSCCRLWSSLIKQDVLLALLMSIQVKMSPRALYGQPGSSTLAYVDQSSVPSAKASAVLWRVQRLLGEELWCLVQFSQVQCEYLRATHFIHNCSTGADRAKAFWT